MMPLPHSLRSLARSPGFTATAVLTLALGIGATAAIFGVIDAVMLRPLDYPEPERINAFTDGLLARLRALPGVTTASAPIACA